MPTGRFFRLMSDAFRLPAHPPVRTSASVVRRAGSSVARLGAVCIIGSTALLGGCIYHLGIQQGNLISADSLAKVDAGMTRSQVRFLLGTPMVTDAFHNDRWDYPYYLTDGRRDKDTKKDWFVVYFKDDTVTRIDRIPGQHISGSDTTAVDKGHGKTRIDLGASSPTPSASATSS